MPRNASHSVIIMIQCRPRFVILWLAAVTWCTTATAAPVAQDELFAAETRRAQGWFKGIGYGSFGFSEEDSAEDDKVEAKSQSESVGQQGVTEKKQEGAKPQETSDRKQQQEEPVFKDYYYGFHGQYEASQKQDEKKSKDESKTKAYAIMEQIEEDGNKGQDEDQERKELEKKLKEYFASIEVDEKKEDKPSESGYSDGELKGHGKLAFSAVHQTTYFPTFNYQDYKQQSKNNDNKETSRFNYQHFFPTKQ